MGELRHRLCSFGDCLEVWATVPRHEFIPTRDGPAASDHGDDVANISLRFAARRQTDDDHRRGADLTAFHTVADPGPSLSTAQPIMAAASPCVPWTINPMARWFVRAIHDQSIARDEPAALSSLPLPCPAPFPAPRAHDLGRPQSRETIAARLISPPVKTGSSRSLRFK